MFPHTHRLQITELKSCTYSVSKQEGTELLMSYNSHAITEPEQQMLKEEFLS